MNQPYHEIENIFNRSVNHIIFDEYGNNTFYEPENLKCALNIIPGSFNPLHAAHRFIYNCAGHTGPAIYEISLLREGKPQYSKEELLKILYQFLYYAPVIVTTHPTFIEKTHLFKSIKAFNAVTYHIGVDTAEKVLEQNPETVDCNYSTFSVYPRIINGDLKKMKPHHKFIGNSFLAPENVMKMSSTDIRNSSR